MTSLVLKPYRNVTVQHVTSNLFECLEHDNAVPANHNLTDIFLFTALLLLDGIIEHHIEEDVVATKGASDFARAVELYEDLFVHESNRSVSKGMVVEKIADFFNSGVVVFPMTEML